MAATLAAKLTGKVAQYQLTGKLGTGAVGPRDSGSIIGTVPPGQPGLKLVDGQINRAAVLTVGQNANFLAQTAGVGRAIPTPATGSLQSDGLSQAPSHE